jgi:hypothetical protein
MRIIVLTALALLFGVSDASAVGWMTQLNCASDYYAFCSQYQVGSPEVRQCMRRFGPKLSKACIDALVADGEVSRAEVDKRKEEVAAKNPAQKKSATGKVVVEVSVKGRPKLMLDGATFTALKNRAPRFVETAEASEGTTSDATLPAPDPQKIEVNLPAQAPAADPKRKIEEQSTVDKSASATRQQGFERHSKAKSKHTVHQTGPRRKKPASAQERTASQ